MRNQAITIKPGSSKRRVTRLLTASPASVPDAAFLPAAKKTQAGSRKKSGKAGEEVDKNENVVPSLPRRVYEDLPTDVQPLYRHWVVD